MQERTPGLRIWISLIWDMAHCLLKIRPALLASAFPDVMGPVKSGTGALRQGVWVRVGHIPMEGRVKLLFGEHEIV